MKGSTHFSEELIFDFEGCPGKSSPFLLFLLSPDEEVLEGIYSLLSDGISFVTIFHLLLYEYDVIK